MEVDIGVDANVGVGRGAIDRRLWLSVLRNGDKKT